MASTATITTDAGDLPAFEIAEPEAATTPFVFCSPHSGRDYPSAFCEATRLSPTAMRRSEDLFVDDLFAFATRLGAPLIRARFPRAYLDVNREPYELDPRMFEDELPAFVNTGSMRVAGGLGTVPRIVAENEAIYARKIAVADALSRIETIYKPFHAALEALLDRTVERFGLAILVDCHSMPSSVRTLPGGRRPDIVIGDRFGTSAASRLVSLAAASFAACGFDVARNKPYAGGFITERYGRPSIGIHALQIEINRGLYADEARLSRGRNFREVAGRIETAFERVVSEVGGAGERPAAAE